MKKLYVSLIMSAMLFMSFVPITDSSWNAEKQLIEITLDPESIEQGSWGDWTQTNCYRHLDFRVKNRGKNYDGTKYKWGVQFRNRYDEKIYFSYEVYDSRPSNPKTSNRMDVKSGANSDGYRDFYMKSGGSIYVYVDKVRFGRDGNQSYYSCDR